MKQKLLKYWLMTLISSLVLLSACGIRQLPDNLAASMLDNTDMILVEDALPAYLVMVDALILTYPKNSGYLATGAQLNSAYAGIFVADPERQQTISSKALDYARRASCLEVVSLCQIEQLSLDQQHEIMASIHQERQAQWLHLLGSTWAGWIQAHSSDWNAVAQLGRVEALLERQVQLAPGYNDAMGELYLAVLYSLLPPALGGQPERAQQMFETAIERSNGQNLIIKVFYAQQFARMMFDQELHDSLLERVLQAEVNQGNLTLQNSYAQRLAAELLAESSSYFF